MMSSDDADDEIRPWAESEVVIYQNERFWVGGGFSKSGLLPTDRRPYSTDDGSMSWKTMELASAAMLQKGWDYVDPEFLPPNDEVEGGWYYSSDFSSNSLRTASQRRRKLTDFVRRRKLIRKTKFAPEQFLPFEVYSKCDHCDSTVTEKLSLKMLETFAQVTQLQKNNAQHVLTDAVAMPLKVKMIEALGIGSPLPDEPEDPLDRLEALYKELDEFPKTQQSVLSKAYHLFENASDEEAHQTYISKRYFPKEERDAIASLVVRHVDPEYKLHCDKSLCGDHCEFYPVACTNNRCDRVISQKHLSEHDNICGFKIISCPDGCGDQFPRCKQVVHLQEACSLRQVCCPFQSIGCTVMTQAKDAEKHMVENSSGHLLMAMNRMLEYQTFMIQLNGRMQELEKENEALKKQIEADNDRHMKSVTGVESNLKSLTKKVSALDSHCKSEFKKIHRQERKHMK